MFAELAKYYEQVADTLRGEASGEWTEIRLRVDRVGDGVNEVVAAYDRMGDEQEIWMDSMQAAGRIARVFEKLGPLAGQGKGHL